MPIAHVESSRPEASAYSRPIRPSSTPRQSEAMLRAASSLGLQPRPASANLFRLAGRPYRPCFPHRSRFKGQMINYAYTDEKKIRKHLLGYKNYHQSKEDGLEFLVAVRCFAYPGGVVSVWVYYGMLDKPDGDDD